MNKDDFLTLPPGFDCRAPGQQPPRPVSQKTGDGGMTFDADIQDFRRRYIAAQTRRD